MASSTNSTIDHVTSGFLQAVAWILAIVLLGAIFAVIAHGSFSFLMGLVSMALLSRRWVRQRRQIRILPTHSAQLPSSGNAVGPVAERSRERTMKYQQVPTVSQNSQPSF
jgi:hypothetical protein